MKRYTRLIEVTACDWCGKEIDNPVEVETLLYNKITQRLHFCKENCYRAHLEKIENDEHYKRLLYLEIL